MKPWIFAMLLAGFCALWLATHLLWAVLYPEAGAINWMEGYR